LSGSQQYPLSGVQDGFVRASGLTATTNTVPATYVIEGSFSVMQLVAALAAVVRRHDALRTVVDTKGGTLFQRALDGPGGVLDAITVRDLRRRKEWQRQVKEAVTSLLAAPFNLCRGQVCRGFLFQVEDRRWVLVLTFAHVIIDGASTSIVAQDLAAALGGERRPTPLQIGELAQREHDIPVRPHQRRFWLTEYGLRRPLPETWPGGIATYHVVPIPEFSPALVRRLDRLRRGSEVSVTSMLGALASVAGRRLTGGDLMIGYATSQRQSPDSQGGNGLTVGALHDHLPAITPVSSEQSFSDYAATHHARRDQSRLHRLPTGHLARLVGTTPYDVAVNFNRFASVTYDVVGGGSVRSVPVEAIGPVMVRRATTAAPPLAFIASKQDDGAFRGVMTGISGLYSEDEIAAFPRLMLELAERFATHPSASIGALLGDRS
jgi:hypothetical protein